MYADSSTVREGSLFMVNYSLNAKHARAMKPEHTESGTMNTMLS